MFGLGPEWDIWIIFALICLFFLGLFLLAKLGVPLRKLFKPVYLLILAAVCILIYGWNRWGVVGEHPEVANMKWVVFIVLVVGLLWMAFSNLMWKERYKTYQFQANGVWGSCARHFDMGDYTIFYLGTSGGVSKDSFMIIPWGFCKKIVIIPKWGWDRNGPCYFSDVLVQQLEDIRQLPVEIKTEIETDATTVFARDQIYWGEISEQMMTENPEIHQLLQKNMASNVAMNTVKNINIDKETELKKHLTNNAAMMKKIRSADDPQPRRIMGSGDGGEA